MSTFNVSVDDSGILQVGFGEPADNQQIVKDCAAGCQAVSNQIMGKLLRVNGRASLQAAMVISHAFGHIVPAIAVFDPKMGKFVIVVSHSPDFALGQLVD